VFDYLIIWLLVLLPAPSNTSTLRQAQCIASSVHRKLNASGGGMVWVIDY